MSWFSGENWCLFGLWNYQFLCEWTPELCNEQEMNLYDTLQLDHVGLLLWSAIWRCNAILSVSCCSGSTVDRENWDSEKPIGTVMIKLDFFLAGCNTVCWNHMNHQYTQHKQSILLFQSNTLSIGNAIKGGFLCLAKTKAGQQYRRHCIIWQKYSTSSFCGG